MIGLVLLLAAALSQAELPAFDGTVFFDDFEDNDITDWTSLYGAATWYASGGMVHGSTGASVAALVPIAPFSVEDPLVAVRAKGIHAFGILARLDDQTTGIYAYVSPDHNVARIRRVTPSGPGTIYTSLNANFPSGVFYHLTLTCDGPSVTFLIEVPSTGDSWTLSATDPYPVSGSFGLIMGDENGASWDWISVQGEGQQGLLRINWFITDDTEQGNGNFCLEPSEDLHFYMELANDSGEPLTNAFGILQSLDPNLTVSSNYVDYGTLPGNSSSYGNGFFEVHALPGTPENQAYPMRLVVMADGGFLHPFDFQMPVGIGHTATFETGSQGWTHGVVQSGWANDWHRSGARNITPNGQYSMKCGSTGSGDYSNHHYGYLQTPYFNFPLSGEVSFWTWIDAQELNGSQAYDGGLVQYRRTDSWVTLDFTPVYSHVIVSGTTGPFPAQTPVYSGTYGWRKLTLALPDSLAGPGAIRFVFGSDNSGNREGWYIDDFAVTDPQTGWNGSLSAVQEANSLAVGRNPFTTDVSFFFRFTGPGEGRIEIFDIAGRLVRCIPVTPSGETQTLVWNGTNSQGNPAATGVYFARMTGSNAAPLRLVKL